MVASWKRSFASGLVVLAPLLVTVWVVLYLFNRIAAIPIPVTSPALRVTLTLVIFVLMVFSVGYLMRTAAGAVLESALDDLINQLPGLRVVYNASKMAVETAIGGAEELQEPVKLDVWDDLRMTAFKTGKTAPDGRDILFLPTAPNITSGYVVEVESDRYEEVDESVEDALTRILSAGFGDTNDETISAVLHSTPIDEDATHEATDGNQADDGTTDRLTGEGTTEGAPEDGPE